MTGPYRASPAVPPTHNPPPGTPVVPGTEQPADPDTGNPLEVEDDPKEDGDEDGETAA